MGDLGLDNWVMAPKDTIISIRRLLGRAFSDPEVQRVRETYLYEIVQPSVGTSDSVRVRMGRKEYSPVEISAMILTKLKADAEFCLGHPVTHAVITVPAYFSEVQREATRKAGLSAGLNVIKLLDEPTAAAIAFGADKSDSDESKMVLVYDLGGGTFDISILIIAGGSVAPLSFMGDMWFGADKFDDILVEQTVKRVRGEYSIDPTTNRRFMVALRKAAREIQERLNNEQTATLLFPGYLLDRDGDILDVEIDLTRDQFNRLIDHAVGRTVVLAVKALAKAGLLSPKLLAKAMWELRDHGDLVREIVQSTSADQLCAEGDPIDEVIMVGNSTRIPRVQEAMANLFGKEKVASGMNPDHIKAIGAAIVASKLAVGEPDVVRALPSFPCFVGVQIANDMFAVFLGPVLTYPTQNDDAVLAQTFETQVLNQKYVRLPIFLGIELQRASLNCKAGEAVVMLPENLPEGTLVSITLSLDKNGCFQIAARLDSGGVLEVDCSDRWWQFFQSNDATAQESLLRIPSDPNNPKK